MLTKDQAFDINEFIYKNGHESLWRVWDSLQKILGEFAINPNKEQIISKFVAKNGAKTVHTLNNAIFKLIEELMKAEESEIIAT
jgi:coenzyme F420-reducing hydrogenase delta subunit